MRAPSLLASVWIVYVKELRDAARDRRTLAALALNAIVIGPILLFALSNLMEGLRQHTASRELVVQGIEHAPALRNYLLRQSQVLIPAPADYQEQLRTQKLDLPVIVIPEDFERELAKGGQPLIEIYSSSTNRRADRSVPRIAQVLMGFASEQTMLRVAMRGVSPALMQVIELQEHDVSSARAQAAQFMAMVPLFLVMAVLYGVLNAALDSTAGEKERGSLDPLLMNPVSPWAVTLGKWAAATSAGIVIAMLSCLGFLPAQMLVASDTLAGMFQFGWQEALRFVLVLTPLAATLAAVVMAISIRSTSMKEAYANNALVIVATSMLPLITLFNIGEDKSWHWWTPALSQCLQMNRILKGEALVSQQLSAPPVVAVLLTTLGLLLVTRHLRPANV